MRQQSTRPIIAAVQSGELDLAVGLCVENVPAGLVAHRLKDERVVLVVASTHAFAGCAAVALEAVRDEVFALDEPAEGRDYDDAVLQAVRGKRLRAAGM